MGPRGRRAGPSFSPPTSIKRSPVITPIFRFDRICLFGEPLVIFQ
jgi:hypothetical protein